ncbi:pantoate--beta-alanine ligase [Ectobacillus sp. JY-23]|uniref:pantoate--beta-alanine ligase n=1 Tax=Ectobacillus sp. JY-23 TaxID=2933872 RepID=UPI001FF44DA6|nr:pantoate--beta-alanine ligase [Ectobacillus sp. JY-23]UOY93445.1 pantoate--beta-alanine ligase [Ectobacillus sp. JY-23]
MEIIRSIRSMQDTVQAVRAAGKTIGFVPTMGYLHEGHLTLLQEARRENDIVVLSVFVNPLQFGPNEDFDKYPRDIERDEQLAASFADYLFYPDVQEMYPGKRTTHITVTSRVDVLCGEKRPGHFDGVATVLLKLFNITMPHRAYFGMKDAQQVAVVQGLITDYNIPVTLVPVPTVREEDGLAKSSRNVYLSEQERQEAPRLYESLELAKRMIAGGERSLSNIQNAIMQHIHSHTSGEVDYVEILSYPELHIPADVTNEIIIAIAVKFSKARLIDNITIRGEALCFVR